MRRGFCSIVTRSYISQLRALRRSIAIYHPDLPHYVLIPDAMERSDLPASLNGEIFVTLPELIPGEKERTEFLFWYTPFEVCCALKAPFAAYALAQGSLDALVYLDCDMLLYNPLAEATWPSGDRSLVITAHHFGPINIEFEARMIPYGTFNAGIFGVRNDEQGLSFLKYWGERCWRHAPDHIERGYFVDQLWLNLAPVVFASSCAVSTDSGLNVGWWNLHERAPRRDLTGHVVTSDGTPLSLFHWSRVYPHIESRGATYGGDFAPLWDGPTRALVVELFNEYVELLKDAEKLDPPYPKNWSKSFRDGTEISAANRRDYLYGAVGELDDPFAHGATMRRFSAKARWRARTATVRALPERVGNFAARILARFKSHRAPDAKDQPATSESTARAA